MPTTVFSTTLFSTTLFSTTLFSTTFQSALLLLCGSVLLGCTNVEKLIDRASTGDYELRRAAVDDIEVRLRDLRPNDPRATEERARIDRFLVDRLRPSGESEPVLRAQYISLALQGRLESAGAILESGAEDPDWHVRNTALKGFGEVKTPNTQQILTAALRSDPNAWNRLEAAKLFRHVGDAEWSRPLIEVLIDEGEDHSLRYQCYLSAVALTGLDLPFVPKEWRSHLANGQ